MPRAKRICGKPNCPHAAQGRYCDKHNAEYEAKRGTKQERGYDKSFRELRKRLDPTVKAGAAKCWRCGKPIPPNTEWHLGHDDNDRSIIRGPEHPLCNLSAAGKSAHRRQ